MGTTGKAVVRAGGKRGVLPGGRVGVYNAAGECPICGCGQTDPCEACPGDKTPVASDLSFWGIYHNVLPAVIVLDLKNHNLESLVYQIGYVNSMYVRVEAITLQKACLWHAGDSGGWEQWGEGQIGTIDLAAYTHPI